MRSKQRYLCKACGLTFTDTPVHGKPPAMKATAVLLSVSGLSMNRTAKLLGVSTPTIQAWLKDFAAAHAHKPKPEGRAVVIELDEMWHDVKKVRTALDLESLDRASGPLVDGECGHRDKAACERLITRRRTRLYCPDDHAVYDVLLPVGQRYTGKDETHGIERDTARQRHWLARFRRRSIVVSKTKRIVDVRLALFARFAGNSRIGDLISMLT